MSIFYIQPQTESAEVFFKAIFVSKNEFYEVETFFKTFEDVLFLPFTRECYIRVGEGIAGTVWFELPACYHPNLGIFLGVWLFQKKKSLENRPYAGQITFWKYNGKSIFFLLFFLNIYQKSSKKNIRIEILVFFFQICLWNQFLTLGNGQTVNTQIRVIAYFKLDHFLKSKIDSKGRFEKRMPIFIFKKKNLKSFSQYLKKSRKGFPIVFLKSDLTGVWSYFWQRQTPQNMPKFGW